MWYIQVRSRQSTLKSKTRPDLAKSYFIPSWPTETAIVGGLNRSKTMPPFSTNLNKNAKVIFLARPKISSDLMEWYRKLFRLFVNTSNNCCKKLLCFIRTKSITFNSLTDIYETRCTKAQCITGGSPESKFKEESISQQSPLQLGPRFNINCSPWLTKFLELFKHSLSI